MRIHRLTTVDSTNDEARRRALAGDALPFVVQAREQTQGRGTRGRSWASPAGAGLYFTLAMVSPLDHLARPGLVTVAAGVACAETLERLPGAAIRLKPINDLWLEHGKLGGVLTEGLVGPDGATVLVIGVGINLRAAPAGVGSAVASLADVLPAGTLAAFDDDVLVARLAEAVAARVSRVAEAGEADLRSAWTRFALDGAPLPDTI